MSEASLERLLGHGAWLRRFAAALVRDRDQADDVAQGAMIAAWQHPPPAEVPVRTWLARVALNQARDQGRSGKRREAREVAAEAPPEPATPEQLVGDLQLHRALAEEVAALEEPYRTTVFLRYYEGLPAAEIAGRLGVPAGTVRWRLKEGLDQIRRQLDARHGGQRERWMAALAPLLPVANLAAPVATTAAAGATTAVAASLARVGRVSSPLRRAGAVALGCLSLVALWKAVERSWETSPRGKADGESALYPTPAPATSPGATSARQAPPRFAAGAPGAGVATPSTSPAPENPEALLRELLAATEAASYDDFLRHGDDLMKAGMRREAFDEAVAFLKPLLARGFDAEPLGTLRKQGATVHLWKLVFTGAPDDDAVAQLFLEGGRVSGFLVQ